MSSPKRNSHGPRNLHRAEARLSPRGVGFTILRGGQRNKRRLTSPPRGVKTFACVQEPPATSPTNESRAISEPARLHAGGRVSEATARDRVCLRNLVRRRTAALWLLPWGCFFLALLPILSYCIPRSLPYLSLCVAGGGVYTRPLCARANVCSVPAAAVTPNSSLSQIPRQCNGTTFSFMRACAARTHATREYATFDRPWLPRILVVSLTDKVL